MHTSHSSAPSSSLARVHHLKHITSSPTSASPPIGAHLRYIFSFVTYSELPPLEQTLIQFFRLFGSINSVELNEALAYRVSSILITTDCHPSYALDTDLPAALLEVILDLFLRS